MLSYCLHKCKLPNQNHIVYKLPMLSNAYILYYDVLWFDISMDDSITVKKRNSFKYISQNLYYLLVLKLFSLLNEFKQMISWAVLHNEIHIISILKQAIKFNNVRMVEIHLNLNLPHKRSLKIFFFY